MKKLLFLFLFISTSLIFAVKPETPPGAGTKDSPYQLSKYEHLLWIRQMSTTYYVYATLTADIDASDITDDAVDESDSYFYGSFDGQGHTLTDLIRQYIEYWKFGDVTYTNYFTGGFFPSFIGECRNLNLKSNTDSWCCFSDSFRGPGDDELGTAENIMVSNAVFAHYFYGTAKSVRVTDTGCFAYEFEGTAESVRITDGGYFTYDYFGTASDIQISGFVYNEDEEYCSNSCFAEDFYGTAEYIEIADGGIFAREVKDSVIRNVTAHNSCVVNDAYYTLIESVTVDGEINLDSWMFYDWWDFGGCVCYAKECTIRNVAVTANISGEDEFGSVGGIVGWDEGVVRWYYSGFSTVSNCYFSGKISGVNAEYIGGIVGHTYNGETNIADCYYDLTGVPLDSNNDGTGVFPEELRMKKTFRNWDFENVWNIEEGISCPTLKVIDKDGFEMIVGDGLSKTKVSLKGTLSDEDAKAIQDSSEICLCSTGSGLEITARQTLEEKKSQNFSFKKKEEATISYKGKNQTLKFSSPVPSITVGKKSGSSFFPCTLSGSKIKITSSAKLLKDVSDYFKDKAGVSLSDLEMTGSVLEGTAVKLTQKGKNLSYKGKETGVMIAIKVNPTKKKVTVKYTGENYVQPTIWRDTKKE